MAGTGVPVTVVAGYLGSGKTTLLNTVLDQAEGRRLAVVVNDFGEIGLDAALLDRGDGRTIELANGCVCCNPGDGLRQAMQTVRCLSPAADAVVVEVSGVGLPAAVAAWGDHPGMRRGSRVVCVDATRFLTLVSDRWVADTVRSQVEQATRVVVTKSDLVVSGDVRRTEEAVQSLAPGVEMTCDTDDAVRWVLDGCSGDRGTITGSGHGAFATQVLRQERPVDPRRLVDELRQVEDLDRVKGVVRGIDGHAYLVQVVGRRVTAEVTTLAPEGAGELVVIASQAQVARVCRDGRAALVRAAETSPGGRAGF